jgi:hypothetical protein
MAACMLFVLSAGCCCVSLLPNIFSTPLAQKRNVHLLIIDLQCIKHNNKAIKGEEFHLC